MRGTMELTDCAASGHSLFDHDAFPEVAEPICLAATPPEGDDGDHRRGGRSCHGGNPQINIRICDASSEQ